MVLLKILPEEFQECVGCPCFENDYPLCDECSYQKQCIKEKKQHCRSCSEDDCLRIFCWVNVNEELIQEQIDLE